MEARLISEVFKNSIYRKKYSKHFLTEKLIENHINVDTPEVSGSIQELQLDGIFIVIQDVNTPRGYGMQVANDFSMFKLHFEIAGSYRYTPRGQDYPLVQIPDFHYTMFYLPSTDGRLEYTGKRRRTLEIIFTLDLVKKMAGDNFKALWAKLDGVVEKGEPFVFWKQPRPISPELDQVLEEIITCPHTGHLKKTYLQAKITTLLVEFFIDFDNGKLVESADEPKVGSDGLRAVENHIKSNLKKDLPIADLAIIAGFNGSKLKRDFKEFYGTTIFKYITRLRMETAVALIGNEGLSVAEAAYEVGYSNPQHFTNAFKRTLGYLPGTLKK